MSKAKPEAEPSPEDPQAGEKFRVVARALFGVKRADVEKHQPKKRVVADPPK